MLSIPEQENRAEIVADIAHTHLLMASKPRAAATSMSLLLRNYYKAAGMDKETKSVLFAQLQPSVVALKKDTGHRSTKFKAIQKYWGVALYERFYQLDEVMRSDKFYRRVGTIEWKYPGFWKIMAIWAINNFSAQRLLNPCVRCCLMGFVITRQMIGKSW